MTAIEKAEALLSPPELEAYRRYVGADKPPLSPSTAAQFFALFLQGYSTQQIAQQHTAFGLGIIVKARVDYDWDRQRQEYVEQLMASVRETCKKSTLESIQFAADGMAVFHRLAGNRFRKYLETGDETVLGDWREMGFRTYKDFVELLLRLTGQDPDKKRVSATVHHVVGAAEVVDGKAVSEVSADRPVTSDEASRILASLLGEGKHG